MQAEVGLHLPNLYSQHCSTQYTFVNVFCGAEQKLFNNVTSNHIKPLIHISQLHPFYAPCWRALPNYGTDAGVRQWIHSGAIVGANFDWPHMLIGGQAHAFIRTPRRVICRQLSHAWKTFYCQSSDRLFSWSGGQLYCRHSPARTWKPEANQCEFASASSALE
ncbi:hypothetical protein O181_091837 [Austropuccinia psidii MF-1]|uniref:Uncharacterized protein n=1 Tax=Austropuccinia psidii MF-1 TaxID=1389203 RepID=A0A9Q3IYB4_9BASI|nr:hypothetical protein [Austropuccinia psidii MF-1]